MPAGPAASSSARTRTGVTTTATEIDLARDCHRTSASDDDRAATTTTGGTRRRRSCARTADEAFARVTNRGARIHRTTDRHRVTAIATR